MKQLEEQFIGKGEVKGFVFTQVKKSDKAYIYEVSDEGKIHYEVFKHAENPRFGTISYPGAKSFGLVAWTVRDLPAAELIFDNLNKPNE
jgi:hypothetical protein